MHSLRFRGKYRIPSSRLPGWDYGRGGTYCVTICTRERICWFGGIEKGTMVLSSLGNVVAEEWTEMAHRRPFLQLDNWVVMPNHFHGLLNIDRPSSHEGPHLLGEAIGHFKGACTRRIWDSGQRDFAWQPRYFDQIVRDEETLVKFRRYILENPLRWERDRHHPDAAPSRP
jgi:REP element-mobilizing transposase RayT